MRKLLVLALIGASAASQAFVAPFPFFPTSPALIERFDTTAAGAYPLFPVFSGLGICQRIGTGGLLNVGPPSPFVTTPNGVFGRGVDIQVRINAQMNLFGGFFKQGLFGIVPPTTATFNFYTASNVLIGGMTVPLTASWQWLGFVVIPKWSRVDIIGNGPLPGYIVMDSIRMFP